MNSPAAGDSNTIARIISMLWGPNIKQDVFLRWSQGFTFSENEPTALVQWSGGPCAVLAPVQAYVLKHIISNKKEDENWRNVDEVSQNKLLVEAVCEIISKVRVGLEYHIVHLNDNGITDRDTIPNPTQLHTNLRITSFPDITKVQDFYITNTNILRDTYGVLLFLYSIILSRGVQVIEKEMCGTEEPLIDLDHGYGSQVLINLMITGNAVAHVFDGEQNVGGFRLSGISKQSDIGFLTQLEHLRYCEVGSFLKKPSYPIWITASETHLTVIFSFDKRLASFESPSDVARRVFNEHDPDNNGFIQTDSLKDVMDKLNLVSDLDYVGAMKEKLDNDGFGIILLSSFMEEFFPDKDTNDPDTFSLYHYNGLPRSNLEGKVQFREGEAILLDCGVAYVSDNSLITLMQTRWPFIDVHWKSGALPSVN